MACLYNDVTEIGITLRSLRKAAKIYCMCFFFFFFFLSGILCINSKKSNIKAGFKISVILTQPTRLATTIADINKNVTGIPTVRKRLILEVFLYYLEC